MKLKDFFEKYPKIALGFSGGVDSSYLLYAAKKYGADIKAYYVKSQFQPQFELDDAKKIADYIDIDFTIINCDALSDPTVCANPSDRCYYCKNNIFGIILENAKKDGYKYIIDGTNASDDAGDRPGMRALKEMQVLSPLQMCGLTKDDVRSLSKEAGMFTWNKPSYACLATRIPTGEEITNEKLAKVEKCEEALMDMGFTDFRIRVADNKAKIQVKEKQFVKVLELREEILEKLASEFDDVLLDLKERITIE